VEQPPFFRPADYTEQNAELARLITGAQAGEEVCVEEMLARFRPLLRARMHWLWQAVREEFSTLEWGDVEAQVHALFLTRLLKFRLEDGVFFPHYISRLLDLDSRDWLRSQRRTQATPFSQLYEATESGSVSYSWGDEPSSRASALSNAPDLTESDRCTRVDDVVSLREALQVLSPAQREVIERCYARGLTEAQAAEELGISRSAVRNRLHGAIERLRAFFGADGALCSVQAGTRTGRASTGAETLESVFWRMEMAKDERRPDLVGVGSGRPVLMQGIFDFPATGLKTPQLLSPRLRYVVPAGSVAGIRFVRIGVTCDALVCVSTVVNGMTHRLLPVAPNSASHIPFAIVEPIVAGSEIEIHVASDKPGTVVIDVGCLEMPS
jgi:RNA polymerase sigma factor (sigma-70 family)